MNSNLVLLRLLAWHHERPHFNGSSRELYTPLSCSYTSRYKGSDTSNRVR